MHESKVNFPCHLGDLPYLEQSCMPTHWYWLPCLRGPVCLKGYISPDMHLSFLGWYVQCGDCSVGGYYPLYDIWSPEITGRRAAKHSSCWEA